MSDDKHSEMHRIDSTKNTGDNLKSRDAELYVVLGIFLVALGLPVILGTWFALAEGRTHAAVVNVIAGLVLVAMGGGSIFYGLAIQKGIRKRR
jgi:small neutral amino acid transporter SnatA (MarC family)